MSAPEDPADRFAERVFGSALGYFEILSVYLGLRLGLYAALENGHPRTSQEVAADAGVVERYAREWLEQQATRGILVADVSGPTATFTLPAAHREVLLDRDSLSYLGAGIRQLLSLRGVIDHVAEAFRSGGGVPYEAYGIESVDGQGYANRPTFLATLPREWLPAIPDLHRRLSGDGVRIVDVGCGTGWSSIAVAGAYPGVRVDGFDADETSVRKASRNAEDAGLADRVRFHASDAAAIERPVDVAMAFECIHDMARPVEVLSAVRRALADDGLMLIVDERTKDTFTGEVDDRESYLYGWSVFDCLPAGMHEQPSAATGAVMRPDTLRRYATEAGFSGFEVLPIEHTTFRLYLLRP